MKPERILICGGRDFNQRDYAFSKLDQAVPFFAHEFCVIQGDAPGADRIGGDWAFSRGYPMIIVRANWDFYKNKAGPIRNEWMRRWCKPDLVIAFPGGTGTAHMKNIARKNGIAIYEI